MRVASDTGPLVALARIDRLDIMPQLFGRIAIPPAVAAEVVASQGPHQARLRHALQDWLDVTSPAQGVPAALQAVPRLSPADREVIALARELDALLIMEERAGRAAAQRLGVLVAGVAEVIRRAKVAGHIAAVWPLLEAMIAEGYWLSPALVDRVARRAGE
jgi:uncharacterized protein